LVLGGITDQPLTISECNVRWRGAVALIIGNDFNTIVLPNSDARVGRPEIDSDRRTFSLPGHGCRYTQTEMEKKSRKKVKRETSLNTAAKRENHLGLRVFVTLSGDALVGSWWWRESTNVIVLNLGRWIWRATM